MKGQHSLVFIIFGVAGGLAGWAISRCGRCLMSISAKVKFSYTNLMFKIVKR